MAIISIQKPSFADAVGTVVTSSFANTPDHGNLLIALGKSAGSVIANASITSGWILACSTLCVTGSTSIGLWYKIAGANESKDVTLTWTGSTRTDLIIMEWAGLSDNPLDQIKNTDDTGGTVTSRSSGTTSITVVANELCLAGFGMGGAISAESWSNSFTLEKRDSATPNVLLGSLIVSITGTYETTLSWTTARKAGGLIATFKGYTPKIIGPF